MRYFDIHYDFRSSPKVSVTVTGQTSCGATRHHQICDGDINVNRICAPKIGNVS